MYATILCVLRFLKAKGIRPEVYTSIFCAESAFNGNTNQIRQFGIT